jgi:hypothetical protein
MPSEVTWNGIAKSYRVGKYNFVQNRMQLIDDDDVIKYLKTTKHFTVIDKTPKKVEAPVEPEGDEKPEATEPEGEAAEPKGDDDDGPKRGPRARATRGK